MNAHPKAINNICHHSNGRFTVCVTLVGSFRPVIEGSGGADVVPEGCGTVTSSDRQTPSPGMTVEEPLPQFAATQEPLRRTWDELEHARQLLGPAPEQLEQEESHV